MDINEQIKVWDPDIKSLARRFVGRFGAELDDLIQEGRIAVWLSLEQGIPPSRNRIRNRQRAWVRKVRRQCTR